MHKYLAVLLLLLATPVVSETGSNAHWFEVRTDHFDVLTDSSERQAREITAQLEQIRSVLRAFIPHAPSDGPPIVVLALKEKKAFRAIEPAEYLAKDQADFTGFFVPGIDQNYILLRLDAGDGDYTVVYHEYTHFLLRKVERIPPWLNEGLAQFCENTRILKGQVLLGLPSSNSILYLRSIQFIPLKILLAVDHSSPYYHVQEHVGGFYSESWALTYLLVYKDRKEHTDRIHDYVLAVSHGEDPVAAGQHAFGDLRALEKELSSFIRDPNAQVLAAKLDANVKESSFQAVAIRTADADVIRVAVLLRNNRRSEAVTLLNAVLREAPENAQANVEMGMIHRSYADEADLLDALKWFEKAIKLDPKNYLAHYYWADLSIWDNDPANTEAIEENLKTAIEINPDFAPAYDTLAAFYSAHNEKLNEAHILEVRAIQHDPGEFRYRMNAAQILVQLKLLPGALEELEIAKGLAESAGAQVLVHQRITEVSQAISEPPNPPTR